MKNMKKIFSFIVCMVFVVVLVSSCGKDVKDKDSSSSYLNSSVSSDSNDSDAADENVNSKESGGDALTSDKNNISDDSVGNKGSMQTGSNGNLTNSEGSKLNKILVQIFEMSSGIKVDKDSSGGSNSNGGGNNEVTGSDSKNGNDSTDDSSKAGNGEINSRPDNSGNSGNGTNVTPVGKEKAFVITVYPDQAPLTCKNFEKLVNSGFYNGLKFYRVIKNFFAETGDPNNDGSGGSTSNIKGEFMQNGVDNRLSHTKGTVSMDRLPSDPNSANSKFFICYDDNCKFMDGQYAAFGKVTQGMNVVEDFLKINREHGSDGSLSLPETSITITHAESAGKDSDGNPKFKFYVEY